MANAKPIRSFRFAPNSWTHRPATSQPGKGPFNIGGYCNPKKDELLKQGRETADPDKRIAIYRKVVDTYLADMPQIILCNTSWVWGLGDRVEGFVPNRDGLIRPQGLRLKAR
jgi:peptide/nickel transport system substrate-binding protein